jgi:hypothetical protein
MLAFPRSAPASLRARLAALVLLVVAVVIAGLLAVSAGGIEGALADAQPTLTVSVKSGTATQTTYTIVASNFPPNTTLTETFGDGSVIDPATGQTDANGSMTRFWTLNVANKYCGTVTAKAATAQATVSFWVALSTDSQAGTPCDGGGSSSTATPDTTATAAAQATASAAASSTPVVLPTSAPVNSAGSGGHGLLSNRLLLIVAAGAVVLVLLGIVGFAAVAGMSKLGRGQGRSGGQAGTWNGGWTSTTNRQQAQGWRQPMQGGGAYGPPNEPPMGARARAQQGWSEGWQQPASSTRGRMPGAGQSDPRWGLHDDERDDRQGKPDPRWSRSQPGARGGPREPGPGQSTASRIRTLRDFTEHRQSVRPPNYDDERR